MEFDTILTILAAIAILLVQLVVRANKRKRVQEREGGALTMRSVFSEEMEETEGMEKEGGYAPIATIDEAEAGRAGEMPLEEEELALPDFTAQKAILYSEVINPKWNS